MILRKISRPPMNLERRDFPVSPDSAIATAPAGNAGQGTEIPGGNTSAGAAKSGVRGRGLSLKWHLSMLTAVMVLLSMGVMTIVAYLTVSAALNSSMDRSMEEKANQLLARTIDPLFVSRLQDEITLFKAYNPDIRISISAPGWSASVGDVIPVPGEFAEATSGVSVSTQSVGGERIMAAANEFGAMVVLAQDMTETHQLISALGVVLMAISAVGVFIAIAAGVVTASAGLKPVGRLQRAVDRITRTDELRPIDVEGNDELANLTISFNAMLAALQESRTRQTQLVADAGHELKTPLTSMRTNIELLMMLNRPGATGVITEEDRKDLERDVLAQMEELSTLIGDLVDLAREDAPQREMEEIELQEVLETSLGRVKRRRPDVSFEMKTIPGQVVGDPFALGRAVLNLMDNAAKWSPPEGTVRIRLSEVNADTFGLTIADSGPGIALEDRERVFERFYRSISSRSMPGSGLGLSIVKKVVERHGGSITVDESDDGGALMRVTLPGKPDSGDRVAGAKDTLAGAQGRGQVFAQRWMDRNKKDFP
ncbi:ATP-binding protein [Corynebacterium sp. A21]|uniref:ATP-binding protein n=1 Tax=Corynebacterium sp. A21 TaxID=3457318 RepID=UPI003FD4F0FB